MNSERLSSEQPWFRFRIRSYREGKYLRSHQTVVLTKFALLFIACVHSLIQYMINCATMSPRYALRLSLQRKWLVGISSWMKWRRQSRWRARMCGVARSNGPERPPKYRPEIYMLGVYPTDVPRIICLLFGQIIAQIISQTCLQPLSVSFVCKCVWWRKKL